jgi:hypothetical protein
LLRIEGPRFARRDAEKLRIKLIDTGKYASGKCDASPWLITSCMSKFVYGPASGRDIANQASIAYQRIPKISFIAQISWESKRQADYRNFLMQENLLNTPCKMSLNDL